MSGRGPKGDKGDTGAAGAVGVSGREVSVSGGTAVTNSTTTLTEVTQPCPAGNKPLGGGWAVNGDHTKFFPHDSAPAGAAGDDGWYVSGTATAAGVTLYVWVVCANVS
jgi:hypothetical protein